MTKQRTKVQNCLILGHLIIHFLTSLVVSERTNEKMSAAKSTGEVSSAEQVSERRK